MESPFTKAEENLMAHLATKIGSTEFQIDNATKTGAPTDYLKGRLHTLKALLTDIQVGKFDK